MPTPPRPRRPSRARRRSRRRPAPTLRPSTQPRRERPADEPSAAPRRRRVLIPDSDEATLDELRCPLGTDASRRPAVRRAPTRPAGPIERHRRGRHRAQPGHRPGPHRRAGLRARRVSPERRLQPGQQHAEHHLRAAPRRRPDGHAGAALRRRTSSTTTRRPPPPSSRSSSVVLRRRSRSSPSSPRRSSSTSTRSSSPRPTPPAPADGRRPAAALFVPQIFFYGLTTLWTAVAQRPPAVRRRRLRAGAQQRHRHLHRSLGLPPGGRPLDHARPVAHDPALLVLLGLGTTAGIVAMTLVLWPAAATGRRPHPAPLRLAQPVVRGRRPAVGLDLGYVIANQVALIVVLAAGQRPTRRRHGLQLRLRVLPAPPRPARRVAHDRRSMPELARPSPARPGRATARSSCWPSACSCWSCSRPRSATCCWPSRRCRRARSRGVRAAPGAALTRQHAGRVRHRAARLLDLPAHAPGLLRLKDTRTPFLINWSRTSLNIVLALARGPTSGVTGPGARLRRRLLGRAAVALVVLRRRIGGFDGTGLLGALATTVAAAAVMGVVRRGR